MPERLSSTTTLHIREDACEAIKVLRRKSRKTRDDGVADDSFTKRLALSSICGACKYLKLRIIEDRIVELRCTRGHDISDKFARIPFGDDPHCMDFSPDDQK